MFFSIFFVALGNTQRENQQKQNQTLLREYALQQEEQYEGLMRNAQKVFSFDALGAFAISSGTDYYERMVRLQKDLQQYTDATRPSVMVHKFGDNTTIGNVTSSTLDLQLPVFGLTKDQYDTIVRSFAKSDLQNRQFVLTDAGLLYIITRTVDTSRIILLTFTPTWEMEIDYGNGMRADYYIADDSVLDLRTQPKINNQEIETYLTEIKKGETTHIATKNTDIFLQKSQYINQIYYLSSNALYNNIGAVLLRYVPYLVTAFILSFIAILYFSRKLYEPIDGLVNTFMELQDSQNEPNVQNEIAFLAKQVANIRHQNADLASAVKESKAMEKKRFLSELVQGRIYEQSLESDLARFDLQWLKKKNYFVHMEVHMLPVKNADELLQRVREITQEQMSLRYKAESVFIPQDKACFIVCADNSAKLEHVLLHIATVINVAFDLPVTFFISKSSEGIETLYYSSMTLEKVYELRNVNHYNVVYNFKDVKKQVSENVLYPVTTEQKLINCVENANLTGAQQFIDYIFKEYGDALQAPETRSVFISALANTLSRCAQRLSNNGQASISLGVQEIYRILKKGSDAEQVKKHAITLICTMVKHVGEGKTRQNHSLKDEIELYVKENISGEISLITMADAFHLTPNYMSTVFKEAMGETFKDYTSRMRFEKSVEILKQNPQITLTDLASTVGINNTTTLLRLYKKYAGCSPSAYSEKIVKK